MICNCSSRLARKKSAFDLVDNSEICWGRSYIVPDFTEVLTARNLASVLTT